MRGYASLNGVLPKCLHRANALMWSCQRNARLANVGRGRKKYHILLNGKKRMCKINYEGSAGSMKSTGVMAIYHSSISKHGYDVQHISEMATKSFQDVVKPSPYPSIVVKNLNVGHVQKRVGKRLRGLKLRYKGIRLKYNKFIGGGGWTIER